MIKSFFFVPGNNQKFINKVSNLKSDYFIFDLEDSVTPKELEQSIMNLIKIELKDNYYVRFSFFNQENNQLNEKLITKLISIGFKNFVIPKFSGINQVIQIRSYFDKRKYNIKDLFKFVLVVEHPSGLLNLNETISKKLINIISIGLGNYDYCSVMGMKHTLDNLYYARQVIVNTAKAYGLEAIDIVNIEFNNKKLFCEEVLNGFSMGFDGKFLIHPSQLDLLKSIKYYSAEEVAEAKILYPQIKKIMNDELSIVKHKGKIFEKPHINRILNIINWNTKYGNK